jgi:hypothetical protein
MKSMLIPILAFAVGFFLASKLYSNAFNPDRFLADANALAASSYLTGCLEAKQGPTEKDKPYKFEIEYCKAKAQELFDKLENLRKDPGH